MVCPPNAQRIIEVTQKSLENVSNVMSLLLVNVPFFNCSTAHLSAADLEVCPELRAFSLSPFESKN
jgi:hypothetical protein